MAEKKFDEMMQRLEDIVRSLEDGELSLEASMKIFEEGMNLVNSCSKKLEEAEQKVAILVKESGGRYSKAPFEMDENDEI